MRITKRAHYDGKFIRATARTGIIETTTGFWISDPDDTAWRGWFGTFRTFRDAEVYLNTISRRKATYPERHEPPPDTLPSETEWSMVRPYLEIPTPAPEPFTGGGGSGGGGGATDSWGGSDD